jgi:hypothetical protein
MLEASAPNGSAKGLPAKPAPSGGADGDVSVVMMLDLQTGKNEAAGALQGLAADRRCDQGGCGRGGRADVVGRAGFCSPKCNALVGKPLHFDYNL